MGGLVYGLAFMALFIAIGLLVMLIAGIIILCIGIRKRKKATGERKPKGLIIAGSIVTGLALFVNLTFWGDIVVDLIKDKNIKCVADEWRIHRQVNSAHCAIDMSDEILEALDNGDKELFIRNFTEDAKDSRGFEDDVDDIFEAYEDYDIGSEMRWDKKRISSNYDKTDDGYHDTAIYVFTSEDDEYSIYLDFCMRDDSDKDEIGLNAFYIYTFDATEEFEEQVYTDGVDSCVKFFD